VIAAAARAGKAKAMKHPLPRIQSAVPRTLHAQLEIAKAVRTLMGPDEDEVLRQRRAEIAAIRHDIEALARDIPKTFEEASALVKAELRAALRKYSPDQPRVPAGNRDGGQWTKEEDGTVGTSLTPNLRYAANGTFPPVPPGYDPNTWKQGQWPNGKYWLEDPDGAKYTVHAEDDRHWRHWDKDDGSRWPPDFKKPWSTQKRPLDPDQSSSDPNGDEPPWTPTPSPFIPVIPEPILPIPGFPIEPVLPPVLVPG
jgi:hypothetical protein